MTGAAIEIALASVLPNATHCADKKWFDIKQPNRGLEVKTFEVNPPMQAGSRVSNVLKRVSKVSAKVHGELRDPTQVGSDVLEYLHGTIEEHAKIKAIAKPYVLAVLLRTPDGTDFAYWERSLHFGKVEDYDWSWNANETLTGEREGESVLQWYSRNQKQLFYLWKAPPDADFFRVTPVQTMTLTRAEYEGKQKSWYGEGYDNGAAGKPRRM